MGNRILLENLDNIASNNITFTPVQWTQYTAQMNYNMLVVLCVGLIIGAVFGACGLYLGLWYGAKR